MREPLYPPEPIYPSEPPPRRAQAAQELLLSFLGFGFAAAVVVFLCVVGRRGLPAVEGVEGSAGLREPRQVRAAGDDAHPCARRRADRRVRARAAHLRADQHHSEARHRRLPFGRGQAASTSTAASTSRASRAPSSRPSRRRSRAATSAPRAPRPSPSRWPRTSCSRSERTIERKLKEAILAIRIERAYSKDKILELYLNEIYFGIGAYGVAAAASATSTRS